MPSNGQIHETDVAILGGGPGGYVAAIRLAQLGKRVTVIEDDSIGGVCLNWGCIPSKTLLHVAKKVEDLRHLHRYGISASLASISMPDLHAYKNKIIAQLQQGILNLFRQHTITLVRGFGRFSSPHEIEVEGGPTIRFSQAIIACGGRPARLRNPAIPDFDGNTIISSKEALNLPTLPKRLGIVGGGIIGSEMATIYQKLGSEVTVFEYTDQLMPGNEPDAAAVVAQKLKKLGATLHLSVDVQKMDRTSEGWTISAVHRQTSENVAAQVDVVLISVGIVPNTDRIELDRTGVRLDSRGFIVVDDQLRTTVPHLFAIGDIIGAPQLAHKASKEGVVAAEAIAGLKSGIDYLCIPAAAFTDPELATVGATEAQLKKEGVSYEVAKFPYAALGRALSTDQSEGFIKLLFDLRTHQIYGIHIVGANASDLISEGALAIEMGATVHDLALTVHPHPTLSELYSEVAEVALGHPIHVFKRAPKPTEAHA